ncbi:M48 family peptidase [Methanofollis formosanus]|uniref:M48 family peptidase n=1 Tax=Methanofollis formosanus TaxID=299308 RepID=A0A8G1EFE5_9EURY|nr:M48 family metallopeptidase [Methanofollis formosanus]QYZ78074.1 M48 family peptidase [Methanofollis formosanus]
MPREIIAGLHDDEYEHPFDHQALRALEATPGLNTFITKLWEHVGENALRVLYTGNGVRVTPQNFPHIHELFSEAREILNVNYEIDLYIQQNPWINACTAGIEKPVIILNTQTVDALTDDELLYIIGHEMGHIKSRHLLYKQTADILQVMGGVISEITFGLGDVVMTGLKVALLHWSRMTEFTADRAGLLACQDINVAAGASMKIAGVPLKYMDQVNPRDFIKQARDFDAYDYQTMNRFIKMYVMYNPAFEMTHPWTVVRAAELMKWIEAGEYLDVMTRKTRMDQG